MNNLKGILFDNDGTLVDTYDIILASFRHATRTVLGTVIPDETLMHKVGQPLFVQMRDFTDDPALQDELLRVYRAHNRTIHDEMISAFPDIKEGLAQLEQAGIRMGVVTSKLRSLAWHGLELTDLAPYLQCCIGVEDCDVHKPNPDPVIAGCEALGLAPENCLYVGDSPFDMQAGNAAGCETVAVSWGVFTLDDMRPEVPTYEIASFPELVTLARQMLATKNEGPCPNR